MKYGDDMRSMDEIFLAAQPSITFGPITDAPKPSGKVLGREYYSDSAGRTILGGFTSDQASGGPGAPEDEGTEEITYADTGTGMPMVVLINVTGDWSLI